MLFQSDRALEITKGFEQGKYDLLESHTSIFELEKIVNEIVESLKREKKSLLSMYSKPTELISQNVWRN